MIKKKKEKKKNLRENENNDEKKNNVNVAPEPSSKFPQMDDDPAEDSDDTYEQICDTCIDETDAIVTQHGFKIAPGRGQGSWIQIIRTQRSVLSDCERILQRVDDEHPGSSEGLFSAALCIVSQPDDIESDDEEICRIVYERAVELLACSDFLGSNEDGEIAINMCGCVAVFDGNDWNPLDEKNDDDMSGGKRGGTLLN